MRIICILFLTFSFTVAASEANLETHEFTFEYGLAYHTLKETQKSNDTRGKLTTNQLPYWTGAYTLRLGSSWGVKAFGGIQLLRFEEPPFGTLVTEFNSLSHFGLEVLKKTGPISKFGLFIMQQDHPLYRAIGPTEFEVFKIKFAQGGFHYQVGQRRRIGLLWGLGLKGYTLFPTKGGDVATESGLGGEVYARLGWVGPLGTLHQAKAFYQGSTAPNAEIEFSHEFFGYCYQVSISF